MRSWAGILMVLGGLLPAQEKPRPDTDELEREMRRFIEVFAIAERQSTDPMNLDQAFYQGAIPGMLRQLDPHSVFFDPDQFEQLKEMQKSVSKGFGSVVSVLPGRVIVLQTQPGSPSAKSGLSPGDEIVAINNILLAGLDMEQLVQVLSMTRQRQAGLAVRRPGTAGILSFTLTPAELQSPSVDRLYELQPGIAYARVTSFDEDTAKLLHEAIEKLGGARLKGLVLDLRENPGGALGSALEAASQFLKPGTRILTARGRSAQTQEIDVPATATPYDFKVAVLIDRKSASAAEIVAGAIQDNDRGVVLGEPSFGKGLVQSVSPLSQGTGLALTTAFYYTPSGRSIQKPLRAGQLGEATIAGPRPEYKTLAGRTVRGGGGIEPDIVVFQERPTKFVYVLEATASFPNFATEYLQRVKTLPANFDVTPALLDEFQLFLSQRSIRPVIAEWSSKREYIADRLKQEILNQGRGVIAGDEVEVHRDPMVKRALQEMNK
jgi:carboxyl-terminal processing protease